MAVSWRERQVEGTGPDRRGKGEVGRKGEGQVRKERVGEGQVRQEGWFGLPGRWMPKRRSCSIIMSLYIDCHRHTLEHKLTSNQGNK